MKYLFIVQGEGRGHMTQAIALEAMLSSAGHQVVSVLLGTSARRGVPDFFEKAMPCQVVHVNSPNFVTAPGEHGVLLWETIKQNLKAYRKYFKSLEIIDKEVTEKSPDVIINFYDFLGGLYFFTYRPKAKFLCIAHQYLASHSSFRFPKGRLLEKVLFKLNNRVTALGAEKKLALSFSSQPNRKKRLKVVPPLLRKELRNLPVSKEPFLLAYVVNHGYTEQIIAWHKKNPEVPLHCFWDKKEAEEVTHYSPNLTFHKINGEKFLHMMAQCSGYISTAGFESICEALYLSKPVMVIPVKGHYEQACNALDMESVKAGIWSAFFDIDRLLDFMQSYSSDTEGYHYWVGQSENIYLKELTVFKHVPNYRYKLKKIATSPLKGLVQTV